MTCSPTCNKQTKTKQKFDIFFLSAPKCPCPVAPDNAEFANPCQGDLTRGSAVSFKCKQGFVQTAGQLTLACGPEGKLLGQMPKCEGEFFGNIQRN